MNLVFGSIVALDTFLFAALLAMGLHAGGPRDGGREMGLAFFVLLPGLVLGLSVLIFLSSEATGWRVLALCIAAVPGVFIAGGQLRSLYIAHAVAQGHGGFHAPAMQALHQAVLQRDLGTLQRLGPTVDVNTAARDGRTLLALAAQDDDRAAAWPVVQALVALGATPDRRLERVLQRRYPEFLRRTHRRLPRT